MNGGPPDDLPDIDEEATLENGTHVTVFEDGVVRIAKSEHTRVERVYLTPAEIEELTGLHG